MSAKLYLRRKVVSKMKLKRILSLLAATTMTVTAVTGAMSVSAEKADKENFDPDAYYTSGECGTTATWLINTDCTLIISGSGEVSKCYETPAPLGPYTIQYWGWENAKAGIKKVVVEEGISLKGDYSFSSFANLTEAVFPSTVTNLHMCLSSGMTKLKDLWIYTKDLENTFDNSNLAYYPKAGSGTKWHIYQNSTTEKSLKDGLKLTDDDIEYITEEQKFPEIKNRTPFEVTEVTETSGPSGFTTKYEWNSSTKTLTFSGTGNIDNPGYYYEKYKDIAEHIVIESGITSVNAISGEPVFEKSCGAFYDFTALKDVDLPDTLTDIGDGTFHDCSSLTSLVSGLPEGLKEIGEYAFHLCPLEGDLKLPETVYWIKRSSFEFTNITSVNLNEEMILGGMSFAHCNSIKEVTIPKDITYAATMGGNGGRPNASFCDCESLEKVIIKGKGTVMRQGDTLENGIAGSLFIRCPSLKEIIIEEDGIEYVAETEFATDGRQSEGTFDMTNNPTFYIHKGSTTEKTLKNAGYLTADNTVYIADFAKLETAISDAESVETEKYTDESVTAFTEALETGKAILEDLTSTQDEVDSAVKAIEDAKNALTEKTDEPSNPSNPSNPSDSSSDPSDSSNPSDSSSNPSDSSNPSGSGQSQPSNSGSSQPTSAQPATNAPTTASPKVTPPTATTVTKPAKVKVVKLKAKKKKLNVSWKKVSGATGYEVKAATNNKFTKNKKTVTVKKNKVTIKNLKPKKKYFVKVRAYKLANGRKYYGKWSKVVKKKVK